MDRRKALAAAGAVSLTAAAAAAAVGANFGLFGLTDPSGGVGKLSPVVATQPDASRATSQPPEVQTVYVDEAETSPATATPADVGPLEPGAGVRESSESPTRSETTADTTPPPPSLTSTTVRHDDHPEGSSHEHEPDD